MRKLLSILLFMCAITTVTAQRQLAGGHSSKEHYFTRDYNKVSLSDALRELNKEATNYEINFLYNELEDYIITTSIRHKTVPDAIRQMIGFYPMRMTIEP